MDIEPCLILMKRDKEMVSPNLEICWGKSFKRGHGLKPYEEIIFHLVVIFKSSRNLKLFRGNISYVVNMFGRCLDFKHNVLSVISGKSNDIKSFESIPI